MIDIHKREIKNLFEKKGYGVESIEIDINDNNDPSIGFIVTLKTSVSPMAIDYLENQNLLRNYS